MLIVGTLALTIGCFYIYFRKRDNVEIVDKAVNSNTFDIEQTNHDLLLSLQKNDELLLNLKQNAPTIYESPFWIAFSESV